MARPTGHLLLLCALLCVWEPVNLAWSVSGNITALATGSLARTVFLGFRVFVASIGLAAGLAIWRGHFHAFAFAKVALASSAIAAVVRFAWFPGNVPPGLRLPYALLFIGYNAAWYAYLVTSPQARTRGPSR